MTRTLDTDPAPLQSAYGKGSCLVLERGPGISCLGDPGSLVF